MSPQQENKPEDVMRIQQLSMARNKWKRRWREPKHKRRRRARQYVNLQDNNGEHAYTRVWKRQQQCSVGATEMWEKELARAWCIRHC